MESAISGAPLVAGNQVRLLADGEMGFLGGINVSDVYASGSSPGEGQAQAPWRDTHMEIRGPAFAQEMEALFQRDVAASVRVDAAAWRDRPVGDRFMAFFSRLFEHWL